MRISLDREACVGSGACVFAEPAVFDQDENDGRVRLVAGPVPEELRESILAAMTSCPVGAISAVE